MLSRLIGGNVDNMKSKALEGGGEVNTVKSLLAGKHITDLIPALFFILWVILRLLLIEL